MPLYLDQFIIVLHRPRDVRNIGAVVRVMKNMGLGQLRLVEPAPFDPADITGIAHRSEDILAAMRRYDSLDAALADAVYVAGTSARAHGGRLVRDDIRALAPQLLERAAGGPVALLFGPEDNGLDSSALDRCHLLVRLPTDPAYPSLNLAQAALLLCYELRMAAAHAPAPPAAPPTPASAGQLAALFQAAEEALSAIEFFKAGAAPQVMRALRGLILRAAPDAREAALLTAMAREVLHVLRRRGIGPPQQPRQ